jgi:energy-coupling factor transport system ATP-binding protein
VEPPYDVLSARFHHRSSDYGLQMAARIDISALSLRFPESAAYAVDSLTLRIPEGSCVGIVGPTGAGKSTLLHCLAGILRRHHPDIVASGNIQIGDESFGGIPAQILFPRVGLVLQDQFVQISGVRDTVFEEILFTLENMGAAGEDSGHRVRSILQSLGIGHLQDRKPTSLSGGETQRVALATILVAQPEVLLLDEPITALDATAQGRLRSILTALRGKTTVLLSDSQIDFPLSICDFILVMDHGKAAAFSAPGKILASGQNLSTVGGWDRWSHLSKELRSLSERGSRGADRILKGLKLA